MMHVRFFGGSQFVLAEDPTVKRVSDDLRHQRVLVVVDQERQVPCVLALLTYTEDEL